VLPSRNFSSFLIARQQVSVDLNEVVEKALRKKLPKLVKAQAVGRILMLEREHMNLLPKQIMAEIEQLHPTFPDLAKVDEIWCAETIFYERERVIRFSRYDPEGHTLAEIAYRGGRVQVSWGPTW
jgi:hypothetical protein